MHFNSCSKVTALSSIQLFFVAWSYEDLGTKYSHTEEHQYLVIKQAVMHSTRVMPVRKHCPLTRIIKKTENKLGFAVVFLIVSSRPCYLPIKQEEQCSLVKQRSWSHLWCPEDAVKAIKHYYIQLIKLSLLWWQVQSVNTIKTFLSMPQKRWEKAKSIAG